MEELSIVTMPVEAIVPYENNPRINDNAVEAVAESIRQCGYVAPIIVDENNVILAGHTRLRAVLSLGGAQIPVIVRRGLTESQKKKYRLLDNKTAELANWDLSKLELELEDLDFEGFDFGFDLDDGSEYIDEFFERGNEAAAKEDKFEIRVTCADQQQLDNCLELLKDNGYIAKQI